MNDFINLKHILIDALGDWADFQATIGAGASATFATDMYSFTAGEAFECAERAASVTLPGLRPMHDGKYSAHDEFCASLWWLQAPQAQRLHVAITIIMRGARGLDEVLEREYAGLTVGAMRRELKQGLENLI